MISQEVDDDAVVDWRLKWLILDGQYKPKNAEKIAVDTSIDYRFAIDLRKNCQDEKLCMRILFGK